MIAISLIMKTETSTKTTSQKLTAQQRADIKSLIEDSGYTRTEATAWVREMGGK